MARAPRERSRLGNTIQHQPASQETIPAADVGLPAAIIEGIRERYLDLASRFGVKP